MGGAYGATHFLNSPLLSQNSKQCYNNFIMENKNTLTYILLVSIIFFLIGYILLSNSFKDNKTDAKTNYSNIVEDKTEVLSNNNNLVEEKQAENQEKDYQTENQVKEEKKQKDPEKYKIYYDQLRDDYYKKDDRDKYSVKIIPDEADSLGITEIKRIEFYKNGKLIEKKVNKNYLKRGEIGDKFEKLGIIYSPNKKFFALVDYIYHNNDDVCDDKYFDIKSAKIYTKNGKYLWHEIKRHYINFLSNNGGYFIDGSQNGTCGNGNKEVYIANMKYGKDKRIKNKRYAGITHDYEYGDVDFKVCSDSKCEVIKY